MKRLKRVLKIVGLLLVLLIAALAAAKLWWDAHYYDGYDPAAPLNIVIRGEENRPEYRRIDFTFDGMPGHPVPALLTRPLAGEGPFPCVIFLHGIGQDKDFLDEIAAPFVQAGFAIVSFDQYTRGERRLPDASALQKALALRRRGALTVIETRRLVDYLQTRPDVAQNRIYLAGASYGAITGSTAAAFEKRIAAVVLIYGGGNLPVLLRSAEAAKELGRWVGPATRFSAFLMAPSDPVKYVAGISPRPVLFQNGTHDSLIPTAAAQALFDAARPPKEIVWYDSDHVGLDPANTLQVLNDAIAWLKKQDARVTGVPESEGAGSTSPASTESVPPN